jgi:hypothetical protein
MRPTKLVAIGFAALLWCVAVYTAADLLTRHTQGENIGKFVGTVFSGIAFGPPVWLFLKWYRTNEGNAAVARRPTNLVSEHPSTGSEQGAQAKLSE